MKRFAAILGFLVLAALALPISAGESRRFERRFAFNSHDHHVGVKSGPVTIESFSVRRWPDPDDFAKGEHDLNDTHTCNLEFRYSNRDLDNDWKCRYVVTVTARGQTFAREESTETLDKGKVGNTHDFSLKMRTHEYRRAEAINVTFGLWRED